MTTLIRETLALQGFRSILIMWTTQAGTIVPMHHMSKEELAATYKQLKARGCKLSASIVSCVLDEIHYDKLRDDFIQYVLDYIKKPETWRMRIYFNLEHVN